MRFPRACGVLLHPTSLPGPHGSGDIGAAAYHFVDWLVAAGQRLWQILPLGGIGAGNSPYMSTSAFAGNVLLIDLIDLHRRGWLEANDVAIDLSFQRHRTDFSTVAPYRMARLERAASRFAADASPVERAQYDAFCQAQKQWLDDYALFMTLADSLGWRDWSEWLAPLARREPAALRAAANEHSLRISFWKFCQWCFFTQWLRLKAYANEREVEIVGDTPIFVAYQSADVWTRPELFELDDQGRPLVVAGVPPDLFTETGQRWGNPLYRWSEHAKDGYSWWVERIRRTFELVDIVRIDHFRGFCGYWEIPAHEPTAERGRWLPGPGAALFKAITSALGTMPIIAEDLGVVTPDIALLRKEFALPGMRILQFAFSSDSTDPFLPHNHERDTVVYPGTHDNDTTRGWWANATEAERQFARAYLNTDGREIHWDLIRAACASVADTAVIPMQDILGLGSEHRMNFPGESEGYWEWRFSWSQIEPWHAQRMAELCRLYGRPAKAPK